MERYGLAELLFRKGILKALYMKEDIKATAAGVMGELKKWLPIDCMISTVAGKTINK